MKNFLLFKLIVLLVLLFNTNLKSADASKDPLFHLGIYGAYNYNFHSATFDNLPGIPCCAPTFNDGKGNGYSFGGLFDYELIPSINLEIRLGYSAIGADLKRSEIIGNAIARDPNTNQAVSNVEVEHFLSSNLNLISLEPTVHFKFFSQFVSLLGVKAGYLIGSKFEQYEKIISPNDIVFIDSDSRTRNVYSDVDIPDAKKFQIFGTIGLGYELNLTKNTLLVPQIRYQLPFLDISSVTWKAASFEFGASLKFPIYKPTHIRTEYEKIYIRDTTEVPAIDLENDRVVLVDSKETKELISFETHLLERVTVKETYRKEIAKPSTFESSIDVFGIAKDGSRERNPKMIIEEFEAEESFPLLPYIFFKTNSPDLNVTGLNLLDKHSIANFNEQEVKWNALEIYKDLLNIVAKRLNENPYANITLTGCNSNIGAEGNNLELSRRRAEQVKDYLVDVWGIDSKRIKVNAQNLPANPSKGTVFDGQIENQRVEISSNAFNIVRPVRLKSINSQANPPNIEILAQIDKPSDLKAWELIVKQGDKELRKYSGVDVPESIKWEVEKEPVPKFEEPINFVLTGKDAFGAKTYSEKSVNIEQITVKNKRENLLDDKVIEKYSLIIFDFDKSQITDQHKILLKSIKENIKPNSKITIIGYTDRIGDAQYNRELSLRRAYEVQNYLNIPQQNLTIKGLGNDNQIYENDSPQGRNYSRTVQIIIETPVK